MTVNFLKLNANKANVLIIHPNELFAMYCNIYFHIDGILVNASISATFAVVIDSNHTFYAHIRSLTMPAFFDLCSIARLCTDSETFICALIFSRLANCISPC